MGQGTSDGYYEEVREVSINILQGYRSQPMLLIGGGPGLCVLLRIRVLSRFSESKRRLADEACSRGRNPRCARQAPGEVGALEKGTEHL